MQSIKTYFLKSSGCKQAHMFARPWHSKPVSNHLEGLYHSVKFFIQLKTVNQTINAIKVIHIANKFYE